MDCMKQFVRDGSTQLPMWCFVLIYFLNNLQYACSYPIVDDRALSESTTGGTGKMCRKADVELDWTWDGIAAPNRTAAERQFHEPLPELEPMRVETRFGGQQYRHRYQSRTIKMRVPFSKMARLPCPVRQLGSRTVSWLRHSGDNVHLLTVGNLTYADDSRLSIHHRYPGNWTLAISQSALEDSGCYQCQINTHPLISLYVWLVVQGPAITVVDDRNVSVTEAMFKSGALIRLICLVRQADKDHFQVFWSKGASILNHDMERGGVSVRTERNGRDAISWLMMVRATSRDSGTYTCSIDNQSATSVSVHVIQGEEQAAVQELTGSARSMMRSQSTTERLVTCLCFLCCLYSL